jgi:hypothetical protein
MTLQSKSNPLSDLQVLTPFILHMKCGRSWLSLYLENYFKVTFMVDESTTISKKTVLVICLHLKLPDLTDASNFFFDIADWLCQAHIS